MPPRGGRPFDPGRFGAVGGEDLAVGADGEPGGGVGGGGGDQVAFGVEDRVGGESAAGGVDGPVVPVGAVGLVDHRLVGARVEGAGGDGGGGGPVGDDPDE